MDVELLKHFHNILIQDIPGLDTTLLRTQVSIVSTNIIQFMVYIRQNQEEKNRPCLNKDQKGPKELGWVGGILHFINIEQV